MFSLRTALSTGLIALTIAGTTIATASEANAHDRFWPGLATGLVGGAILGGALSQPNYYAPPAYYGPAYRPYVIVRGYPRCHIVWRQDRWGDQYRTRVCY
jgi:hypothetical protein